MSKEIRLEAEVWVPSSDQDKDEFELNLRYFGNQKRYELTIPRKYGYKSGEKVKIIIKSVEEK